MRLRLLPFLILALMTLFVMKVMNISEVLLGAPSSMSVELLGSTKALEEAHAATEEKEEKEAAGHDEKAADKEGAAEKEKAETPATEGKKEEESKEKAEAGKEGEEKKEEGHGKEGEAKEAEGGDKDKKSPYYTKRPKQSPLLGAEYSPAEVDLLQTLAKRREKLESWEKEMREKESILKAAEQKIDTKLEQLKVLKEEVNKLLSEYNQKEDQKIQSLVKIYESMKPKDAARIFEEIEMPILLEVIGKMKEAKVAPILAQMDAAKAKEVTIALAEQRKITQKTVRSE